MTEYALRKIGSSSFAARLPLDYEADDMVPGWDNAAMLRWATADEAESARQAEPFGDSFMVEEVDTLVRH